MSWSQMIEMTEVIEPIERYHHGLLVDGIEADDVHT